MIASTINFAPLFGAAKNKQKATGQKQGAAKPKAGAKKAATRNASGLKYFYSRPQAQDTITHKEGGTSKLTSLIDGGQIFWAIDKLLAGAKKSVLVDVYSLQNAVTRPDRSCPPGTPGADKQQKIVDHLIQLAKDGCKVKVILDNHQEKRSDAAEKNHNDKMIDHLKKNGVEVVTYPNAANINHVKLLVVDNKFAVIGGMNWGNHSPMNHDASVMVEGAAVGNLVKQVFNVDWEFSTGSPPKGIGRVKAVDEERIKVITTTPCGSPDGGQNEIFEGILDKIDNAKESIVAELFVLTDKIVAERLIEAHKRLKKNKKPGVRILVDPGLYFRFKNCRPTIDKLKKAGIPIRFYKVDWTKEEKLHAKWAVFDKEDVMVGSANWSRLGLWSNCPTNPDDHSQDSLTKGNHEAGLLIKSKALAKAFVKQFNFDWYKKSTPMWGAGGIYRDLPDSVKQEMFGNDDKDRSKKKTG